MFFTKKIFLEENHLSSLLTVGHVWGDVWLHRGFWFFVGHAWGDVRLPHGTGLLGIIVGRLSGLRLGFAVLLGFLPDDGGRKSVVLMDFG